MARTAPATFTAEHFRCFYDHADPLLRRLDRQAAKSRIPTVGPAMGKLLFVLARAARARRVLELGTSIGYSTIWLARSVAPSGGNVVSLEWDPKTAGEALRNMAEAGVSKYVKVETGDAKKWLEAHRRGPKFDFAFNDIDKEMYPPTLDPLVRLVRPGGRLVFDNTAFRSAGDFLKVSARHPDLETVHLHCFLPGHAPDLDAVTPCVKRGRAQASAGSLTQEQPPPSKAPAPRIRRRDVLSIRRQ